MKPIASSRSVLWRVCLVIICAVALAEASVWIYRSIPLRAGSGSVYNWQGKPGAIPVEDNNTRMARDQYKPDSGGQWRLPLPDKLPMTLYYFAWDELATAPTMVLDGHHAELCNEAAGFKLDTRLPSRHWSGPDGDVEFDVTRFTAPDGMVMIVFKNVWLGNTGNWDLRKKSRLLRLKLAFARRKDPARLVQGAVHGVKDPDAAWEIFQKEVLSGMVWSHGVDGK